MQCGDEPENEKSLFDKKNLKLATKISTKKVNTTNSKHHRAEFLVLNASIPKSLPFSSQLPNIGNLHKSKEISRFSLKKESPAIIFIKTKYQKKD